ncbi:four-helix bundle copper-binding protein [Aquabacterium sp.]|uniref:four-helix bundle copper-binding protein n=1 Tax=Aquabacterium sp. TaxID=1872578 RepID=UPI002C622F11|nr:four-helix bundle copper-binding protein [Aquabacterium sp.]HSW03081.1 four-helix bundle copper-binding protein [Aquabacterium sp.]
MPNHPSDICLEACNACATACSQCLTACLQEPHVNALTRCIALDIECAEICRFTAAAVARGSEPLVAICRLCAESCDLCAEECSKHEHEHCQRCADACMKCAAACHQMVEHALEGEHTTEMAHAA